MTTEGEDVLLLRKSPIDKTEMATVYLAYDKGKNN
jgi:hypothetical protein